MKKTLVMTLVLALLLSVVSVVSAATEVTADVVASEIKDGEATVTITLDTPVEAAKFTLKYDAAKLTLDKVNTEEQKIVTGADGEKTITIIALKPFTTLTITFKVAEGVKEADVTFVPFADGFGTVAENPMDFKTGEVTVTAKTVETKPEDPTPENPGTTDPEPEKPGETEKPGTQDPTPEKPTEKPADKTGETDSKDEKPGKYSQTGANVLAIALPAVAMIALAGVAISKKND